MAKKTSTVEKWGFREAARHLGISWKTARKWGAQGILPVLPESEWEKGPVTVFRRHFKNTPFGPEYTHTTEEPRIVDKVFDADAIRAVDVEALRDRVVFDWLDEHQVDVSRTMVQVELRLTRPATENAEGFVPSAEQITVRAARELRGGVTVERLTRWLADRRVA